MKMSNCSRRRLLGLALVSPLAFFGVIKGSRAQTKLSVEDPQAKALCYHLKASEVKKTEPGCQRYEPGQNCANCMLYTAGPDAKEGPCTIFQNRIVPAEAWCGAWVARPK